MEKGIYICIWSQRTDLKSAVDAALLSGCDIKFGLLLLSIERESVSRLNFGRMFMTGGPCKKMCAGRRRRGNKRYARAYSTVWAPGWCVLDLFLSTPNITPGSESLLP